jgi:uncharacterized protein YbjQ (UPF0145 family)
MQAPPSAGESLQRQALWEQALSGDRLPEFVIQRLNDARDAKTPWIATMTAAELLVAKTHGIRPVAMVSATCALHYGFSWTRGHAEGWRTALGRLSQEAVAAGANAVVDVKLRTSSIGVIDSMDYTLVGTAVTIDGLTPSARPVISTVPALEFVRLLEAGIVPVGIAIGAAYDWLTGYSYNYAMSNASASFYAGNLDGQWSGMNRPLTQLGEFWERIRRLAIAELTSDTRSQGDGVLAHTHFGQLLKREGDNQPPQYLGRHIVMGTVVDIGPSKEVPHEIRMVVDMRDGESPFKGATSHHNNGPVEEEKGEI